MNIHIFDGKINTCILRDEIDRVSKIRDDLIYVSLRRLETHIHDSGYSMNVEKCIRAIVRDYKQFGRIQASPNYESSNNLYASDLLYLCCEQIFNKKNKEFERLLIQQLEEMTTGLCPSGRCTRLYQIAIIGTSL